MDAVQRTASFKDIKYDTSNRYTVGTQAPFAGSGTVQATKSPVMIENKARSSTGQPVDNVQIDSRSGKIEKTTTILTGTGPNGAFNNTINYTNFVYDSGVTISPRQ